MVFCAKSCFSLTLLFIFIRFNICKSLWIKNRFVEGCDYGSRGNSLSWWPFLFWCFLSEWLSQCTAGMLSRLLYLTCIIFMFTILNLKYESRDIFQCSKSTTTLVDFGSTQIYIIVAKYASVYLTPGMAVGMRSGFQVFQQCYRFWSPYKVWSWIQNLTLMSLDMQV